MTEKWLKIIKDTCLKCNAERESVVAFEKKSYEKEKIVGTFAHKCLCERTLINKKKVMEWKRK